VQVASNLKFDVSIPASVVETADLLKASWTVTRPALVAGSTHEGDEEALLSAFKSTLASFPDALLIVAPRHPERFRAAAQLLESGGLEVRMLSTDRLVPPTTHCLVIDTMGELLNFYAAADLAFVGGTFADIGGHNIIEPAALGKPILVGPHTRNLKAVATQLIDAGAAIQLQRPGELGPAIQELFSDPSARDAMGQAGLSLVEQGRGSVDRTVALIEQYL
jgi:3-deoxy-D-manno-octulosonic-acid transferase